ncbi:MAG: hypothetical protein H7249_05610 [Chitinophagaceae bacterium]|nr:hypothetical protein [Oligoflexus sp.]
MTVNLPELVRTHASDRLESGQNLKQLVSVPTRARHSCASKICGSGIDL